MVDVLGGIKGTVWPKSKRGLGAPIYVEEDGPVLGVVDDVFVDRATGKPLAYRIQAAGQFIELPAESITETQGGFVYRSPWLTEADAVVRKLEGQELLMPELLFSSQATQDSDRKILSRAIEKSPALKSAVDEARDLYKDLLPRQESMERERTKVVNQIAEITEGMATGRLDKGAYREGFIALRRRLQLLDATVRRIEVLRTRLEHAPFIQASLNGGGPSPFTSTGEKEEPRAFTMGPMARPEEWKRIKKFRVLKAEKDLEVREARLKQLERDMTAKGAPVSSVLEALSSNFDDIVKAHLQGPDALRRELERRITPNEQSAPSPETAGPLPEETVPTTPARGGKTCPFCAEPLNGTEKICPTCHGDLKSVEPAGKGSDEPPGKMDKFMKGGGAIKTGVILLLISGAIFLLRFLAH